MVAVRPNARISIAALVTIAGAMILVASFPAAAQAKPCERNGDARPTEISAKDARRAVTCLINHERDQRGKAKLGGDGRLHEAARDHSRRMADRNCFSHKCRGERSVLGRLEKVRYIVSGLSRWSYGENIAWGESSRGTPRAIVNAWMNSPGHRANILNGTFRDVGVGFDRDGDRGYYTADFGLRVG